MGRGGKLERKLLHRFVGLAGAESCQSLLQHVQAVGIASRLVPVGLLCIIELAQFPFAQFILRNAEIFGAPGLVGEEEESPQFRIVNVDYPCGSPHPVVLRKGSSCLFVQALGEGAFFNVYLPLNPGEIHTVVFA